MDYFSNRLVAEVANKNVNLSPYNKLIGEWNFIDIQQNLFIWESIWSKDNGENWHIATRVQASRK